MWPVLKIFLGNKKHWILVSLFPLSSVAFRFADVTWPRKCVLLGTSVFQWWKRWNLLADRRPTMRTSTRKSTSFLDARRLGTMMQFCGWSVLERREAFLNWTNWYGARKVLQNEFKARTSNHLIYFLYSGLFVFNFGDAGSTLGNWSISCKTCSELVISFFYGNF